VWAAAASLYFLLTGAFPRDFVKGKDPWQTVLQTDPVKVRQRDPAVPARLADVIDQALVDRPAIPFKTAADFRRALQAAL
jgi:serine/threonine-protein kinase